MREIKGTLIVVSACCLWHISTAFILNGTGLFFLGMPAWFSVSVFGTIVIALVGVRVLLKKVFIDFEYDAESDEAEATKGSEIAEAAEAAKVGDAMNVIKADADTAEEVSHE